MTIYAKVLFVILVLVSGVYLGYTYEKREVEKVTSDYEAKIAQSTSAANRELADLTGKMIRIQQDRDDAIHQLEIKNDQLKQATADLSRKLAAAKLYVTIATNAGIIVPATGQNSDTGPSGSVTSVALSDSSANALRQLAREADETLDAYILCHNFVVGLNESPDTDVKPDSAPK
jgi:uncharacterized protein (UPF0333 family)